VDGVSSKPAMSSFNARDTPEEVIVGSLDGASVMPWKVP
jgi:hypothetical protein